MWLWCAYETIPHIQPLSFILMTCLFYYTRHVHFVSFVPELDRRNRLLILKIHDTTIRISLMDSNFGLQTTHVKKHQPDLLGNAKAQFWQKLLLMTVTLNGGYTAARISNPITVAHRFDLRKTWMKISLVFIFPGQKHFSKYTGQNLQNKIRRNFHLLHIMSVLKKKLTRHVGVTTRCDVGRVSRQPSRLRCPALVPSQVA